MFFLPEEADLQEIYFVNVVTVWSHTGILGGKKFTQHNSEQHERRELTKSELFFHYFMINIKLVMKSATTALIVLTGLGDTAAFLSPSRSGRSAVPSFTQGHYLYDPDRHEEFNYGNIIDFESSIRDRNGGSMAPFGDAPSVTSFRDRGSRGSIGSIAPTTPSDSPLATSPSRGKRGALGEIWENSSPITVQGGSLRTFQFADPNVDAIQVLLKSRGRPIDADVELWNGPNNTPHKMKIYVEDGAHFQRCGWHSSWSEHCFYTKHWSD